MDTNKLAKRLAKLQEKANGGGGKNVFFKSKDEKQKIRMVPYPHSEDGIGFIEAYFHFNVAGHRSLLCPKETFGEPCPICELAEEFKNMGNKDSWKQFKKYSPKLRTYSPVIIRGEEDEGVKLWGYGSTIYEALLEKFMDSEWGNLSDPKTGRDLTVWTVPKGSAANDTDYDKPKMDVSPNQSPLFKNKAEISSLLESIPDYMNDGSTFPVRSYQELKDIVSKLVDDVDDDSSTSYANSTVDEERETPARVSSTGGNDVADRLAQLLGD